MKTQNVIYILRLIMISLMVTISNFISINFLKLNTLENIYWASFILGISTIFFGFNKLYFSKRNLLVINLYFSFLICCFISQIIHHNFNIYSAFAYLILTILTLMNTKLNENFDLILLGIVLGTLPIIIKVDSSNTFGLLISLGFVALYSSAYGKKNYMFWLLTLSPLTVIIVFLTGSRTSFIGYIIFLAIYYLEYFVAKKQSIRSIIVNLFYFALLMIFLISYSDKFYNLIFHKRVNISNNFLADRQIYWEGTFKFGLTKWGNGSNFFIDTFSIGNSHNFFIELLGIYGLIPTLIFIIFSLILLMIIFNSKSNEKFRVLIFFLFYFLTGMTENLFFLENRLIIYHFLFLLFVNKSLNLAE